MIFKIKIIRVVDKHKRIKLFMKNKKNLNYLKILMIYNNYLKIMKMYIRIKSNKK